MSTAKAFLAALKENASEAERKKYERYFLERHREFLGVRMGTVFALAKEHGDMPVEEIEKLLESDVREARAGALRIAANQARAKKASEEQRKALYDLVLRRTDRIDDWDLVDLCATYVVGSYLVDKPRKPLYKLAKSRRHFERRLAIVSTMALMDEGDAEDAFAIAEMLLEDKEDLMHKATGGVLRFAGDNDPEGLRAFLDRHAATMPRVMLRYALEHVPKKERERYMAMGKGTRERTRTERRTDA